MRLAEWWRLGSVPGEPGEWGGALQSGGHRSVLSAAATRHRAADSGSLGWRHRGQPRRRGYGAVRSVNPTQSTIKVSPKVRRSRPRFLKWLKSYENSCNNVTNISFDALFQVIRIQRTVCGVSCAWHLEHSCRIHTCVQSSPSSLPTTTTLMEFWLVFWSRFYSLRQNDFPFWGYANRKISTL